MNLARPFRSATAVASIPAASIRAASICAAAVLATCSPPGELRSSQIEPESGAIEITTTPTEVPAEDERPIAIHLRLDRRVDDEATAGFESFVETVMTDQRGWVGAGFEFTFSRVGGQTSDAANVADHSYTVILAEGPEVDSLCLPYDTFGRFSCQIGPVVALNADRWRTAVDDWPADLEDYRTMLVNHEIGHLLGQHHPESRCAGDGQPAPVMAQQSSGVDPCTANPWPLDWEIACAASGLEPLAPPFERDIKLTCGPDGPMP